ncbi:MAG TPA: cytochrome c-type biogenesis protein [Anaerolineales bacterium]|nr:cytochrome c-type biogenesis protein [Anaerolineales bacterium]
MNEIRFGAFKKQSSFALCVFLAIVLAVLLAVQLNQRASAQAPTPTDDEVNRIAHQLYCPVCENTPLDVCPTEACRQWRDLIRQQLSQGWTEDQIKQYFIEQYGASVVGEPPRTGLNWLVYVLPPLIILSGAFLLLRALRAWTKPSTVSAATQEPEKELPQNEYITRIEEELKKRK